MRMRISPPDAVGAPAPLTKAVLSAIWICVAVMVALMAARGWSAMSYLQPLQVTTSGAEWESLLPLWRRLHGLPVYLDRFQPPFNSAHYNWLFYEAFGALPRLVMRPLGLGDAWLPTIARHVSVLGMILAVWVAARQFLSALGERTLVHRTIAWSLALLVGAGPVVGWWGLTARPDLLAMTLEICAVGIFLRYYPDRRWLAILGVALFCYAAWSLKQVNASAGAAIGLVLLFRRDWAAAALLAVLFVLAVAAAFVLGDPQYLKNVAFAGYPLVYEWERLFRNLFNFAIKTLPILIPLALLLPCFARQRGWRENLPAQVALSGTIVAALVSVPTSSHTGAAENYYFTLMFFLALLAVVTFKSASDVAPGMARLAFLGIGAGWLVTAAGSASVLGGWAGTVSVRAEDADYRRMTACIANLPKPMYMGNRYMSLPWMTPGNESFVLSYVYPAEREQGRIFEGGGIGGRVASGYFASLALHATLPVTEVDSAPLDRYAPVPTPCDDLKIYVRRDLLP